jgi:alpha-beta hydrolase superfamily lysophospholipase
MFATIRVLSGDPSSPSLEEQMRRITAPTLMISAGKDVERDFNVLYDRAASGRVEHWNLPQAHHTRAIHEQREEYERRVVAFLDEELSYAGRSNPRSSTKAVSSVR